jgi:hypothetical protein
VLPKKYNLMIIQYNEKMKTKIKIKRMKCIISKNNDIMLQVELAKIYYRPNIMLHAII